MNLIELDVGKNGVASIRIESPNRLNFLGPSDIARLIELVDRVAGDGSTRGLILAGGENFTAGTDFFDMMRHRLDPEAGQRAYRFLADQKTLCDRIRGLRIPTLSVARGLCAGRSSGRSTDWRTCWPTWESRQGTWSSSTCPRTSGG